MDHILNATNRTETGKRLAKFRREGKVPANIFRKHADSTQIWVDANQLKKMMLNVGEGSLLYIQLNDEKTKHPTILRHVDFDIRRAAPMHASFQEVSLKEEVTVEIELDFVGEAAAVKAGLVIETPITAIEISALPTTLPEKIEVDISKLEAADDRIIAGDIMLPKGVTLVTEPHSVIVSVVEPMSETAEETEPTDEASAVASVEAAAEKGKEDSEE